MCEARLNVYHVCLGGAALSRLAAVLLLVAGFWGIAFVTLFSRGIVTRVGTKFIYSLCPRIETHKKDSRYS